MMQSTLTGICDDARRIARATNVLLLAATAMLAVLASAAAAQWKPSKTVEVIISSKPGGGQDLTGRTLAAELANVTGVKVIPVNKPGGAGAVAYQYLNAHEGHGNYIAISSGTILTSHIMGVTHIGYKDITPLAEVSTEYAFFSVRADSPLKSGKDLIEALKKNPQSLSIYTGVGLGSPTSIAIAKMAIAAGIDPTKLKLVPFGSGGKAMAALLGGHIDVHVATAASVIPRKDEGKIRILAVAAPHRLGGDVADVPTWKEQGYDVVGSYDTTVFGPKGMSKDQIAYWNNALSKAVKTKGWKDMLHKAHRENIYLDSGATEKYYVDKTADLTMIMKRLGLI